MNVAFFGSSVFSKYALDYLIKYLSPEFKITSIVTNKDEPVGRGSKVVENIVKTYALENKLNVFEAKCASDSKDFLIKENIDLCIVASYGKILKKDLLETPKYGFLNIHGSLLPKYRGAIPIQMAIFDELKITGISIIKMDVGMDDGDILIRKDIKIENNDNFLTLGQKMADLGAKALSSVVTDFVKGNLKLLPQDNNDATYCYIKDVDKIKNILIDDFDNITANKIDSAVRSLAPNDKIPVIIEGLECLLVEVKYIAEIDLTQCKSFNNLYLLNSGGEKKFIIKCHEGFLQINKIQPKNKSVMEGVDFWNGYIRSKK